MQKALGAAVQLVHLLKRSLEIFAARDEYLVKRPSGTPTQRYQYNAPIYKEILDAAGPVCTHIIAHDLIAVNAKRQEHCGTCDARTVLALRAVLQNRAGMTFVQQHAYKLCERFEGGLLGYHDTICI